MKKIQFVLLALYLVVALYFAILNWDVFSVSLKISLGFFIINLPLIAMIFLLGLTFLLIQWGLSQLSDLKLQQELAQKENEINSLSKEYELKSVKKDNEINALKASLYDEQEAQIKENSENITEIKARLDELVKLLPDDVKKAAVENFSAAGDIQEIDE